MSARKAHHIWIEQCEAAQTVRARFGLTAAFDYLVGGEIDKFCQCRLDTSRLRARAATLRFRG